MDTRETLEKTRGWIEAEIERAKKPYADKFDLTSLTYCVSKAVGPEHHEQAEEALAVLRSITLAQKWPRHDVVDAEEALGIIDAALQ